MLRPSDLDIEVLGEPLIEYASAMTYDGLDVSILEATPGADEFRRAMFDLDDELEDWRHDHHERR